MTADDNTVSDEPEAVKVATLDESTESRDHEATDETAVGAESGADKLTEPDTLGEIDDPAVSRRRRSTWTLQVSAGVLAALLIASAGLTAWLYFHSYRPDQQTGIAAANSVLGAAKSGIVAALSYSADSLDKDLDQAKVLVFVNQTATNSDRPEPSQSASSVVVTMDKVDGKWLISAFDAV